MDPTVHAAWEAATLESFLRALEAMADELASRGPDDIAFKVTARDDVPLLGILGDQINRIGADWERHQREEGERAAKRTAQLSRAYEALQAKNDEIQRDLEAARRVQLQLLPQPSDLSQVPELDFAGHYQSKDKVGGDIYDFYRVGRSSWALLIADVSGHGIPPALLTMFLKAAFRTRSRWGVDADAICLEVNEDLCAVVSDLGLYVTAFFGIVDLESQSFRYANCGHPPVYLYRPSEDRVIRLEERGMILGALEEVDIAQSSLALESGDVILATTDGIPESRDYLDEMYGEGRLLDSFTRACRSLGSERRSIDLIRAIITDLRSFTLDAPSDDDVTAAALRFIGEGG